MEIFQELSSRGSLREFFVVVFVLAPGPKKQGESPENQDSVSEIYHSFACIILK